MTNWIPVSTPPPYKCAPKDFVFSLENDDIYPCSEWVLVFTKFKERRIARLEQWDDDDKLPPKWIDDSRERLDFSEGEILFWTPLLPEPPIIKEN